MYEQEWVQNLMQQIVENLQSHVDWIGIKRKIGTGGTPSQDALVRMLDYACGFGVASRVHKHFPRLTRSRKSVNLIKMIQALFPYVSEVRGIDVSDGMVEKYNKSARSHGVPESHIFAIQGDLASPLTEESHPSLSSSDFFEFDLIIMSMALHHIDVPKVLIERLVERLNEGGVVVIIDWTLNQEGSETQQQREGSHSLRGNVQNPGAHTVSHAGFSKEQMDTMLKAQDVKRSIIWCWMSPPKFPSRLGGRSSFSLLEERSKHSSDQGLKAFPGQEESLESIGPYDRHFVKEKTYIVSTCSTPIQF